MLGNIFKIIKMKRKIMNHILKKVLIFMLENKKKIYWYMEEEGKIKIFKNPRRFAAPQSKNQENLVPMTPPFGPNLAENKGGVIPTFLEKILGPQNDRFCLRNPIKRLQNTKIFACGARFPL